jgi:hypothetical protein
MGCWISFFSAEKEKEIGLLIFVFLFSFFQIGSGANPHTPAGEGGGWQSESQPVFNGTPKS